MREDIKKKLLAAKAAAADEARAALQEKEAGILTKETLEQHVLAYILAKFHLSREEIRSTDLNDLAEQSLAKTMKIDIALVEGADKSPSCDGASSVEMKQALLIMALQKDLHVKLDGIKAAFADTAEELSALIWEQFSGEIL